MLVWFLIRDEQVRKPFAAGFQTGLSFTNGTPSRPGRSSARSRSSVRPEHDRERDEHDVAQRRRARSRPTRSGAGRRTRSAARARVSTRVSGQQHRLQRIARGEQRRERREPEQVLRREHRRDRDEHAERRQQRERAIGVDLAHASRQQQREGDRGEREDAPQPACGRARDVLAAVIEGRAGVRSESAGRDRRARPPTTRSRGRARRGSRSTRAPARRSRGRTRPARRSARRPRQPASAGGRAPACHGGRGRERDELERPGEAQPGARAARTAGAAARHEDRDAGGEVEAREREPARARARVTL